MSELLLPPEHRYAKIMKEKLNEDGSELSILNLGPTHPATHGIFQNVLLMDGERILEAEPTIGYIHRALKLQKTDLLPNNSPYRSHELLLLPYQ
jgi:NADH-quinone oxidoreductase subunit D